MFERFTERARMSVVLAQEEAMRLQHNYIGTEHLLLGLLRGEDSVAAQALASLNVTLDEVREQVESVVGRGEGTGAQAPFTPRSKKVLELALREALQLGHNYIGTEHILLGLAVEREGVAARALSDLGVTADDIRREVVRRLGGVARVSREEAFPLVEAGPREYRRDPAVFRGRVEELRVTAHFDGQPETLLVDLDYAYAVRDAEDASQVMDHENLLVSVVGTLESGEFGSVESGVELVGERVLEGFPAIREITISVTDQRVLGAHAVAGFKVIRTFRR